MTTRNAMLVLFVSIAPTLLGCPPPPGVTYHCTCRNGGSVVEIDQTTPCTAGCVDGPVPNMKAAPGGAGGGGGGEGAAGGDP
jgi:hypothetical protein